MAVLQRYLAKLDDLIKQAPADLLTNIAGSEKNTFGFGKAVGTLEGLRMARALFDSALADQEADTRGVSGRSNE